jgi:ketosteroid isomerase-like protein
VNNDVQGPVDRFFRALNVHDVDELRDCLHPDFEMVVPQKPVLRRAGDGHEVWTETVATATGLEMAAVVIWTADHARGVLVRGRYYSEPVQRDAPVIGEFMHGLAGGGER